MVGNIISRFESKVFLQNLICSIDPTYLQGLVLTSIKLLTPTEELLSNHYSEHRQKPFFTGLVKSLSSGPVVAMVWRGPNAVRLGRNLIGSTNPSEAVPGTIRGDLAVSLDENVCHGSDSVASAEREISIWFPENGDFCG